MDELESLNHGKREPKHHVVFIPKCRRNMLYSQPRQYLGEVFRKLAAQKESRVEEVYLMSGHVHRMILIPPKYAVSQVVGFIRRRCHSLGARLWREPAEFRGAELLGTRVFRIYGRSRRRSDLELYPKSVTGGPRLE